MKIKEDAPDEVCTTQQAAEILGISVSSVQQLVEAGVIEAWKTKGGHRRIPRHAVLAYKSAPALAGGARTGAALAAVPAAARPLGADGRVSIMVIEDNPMQRALYERQIDAWELPVHLTFCENGYQALLQIARGQPDVLLADIVMDGIDGYEVIRTILDDPKLASMRIAILSGLTEQQLEERGGVPPGVVFFAKPVNYDELRGYLRGCIAQRLRELK
ncbi:response regulator [Duganella sp. LX20W]|uniref:Response regulator n=1 Tax=Rugamonas brunnea TaxID=2758569 RepID=A0A7W2ES61_9BURK|nr:response regulator [Rugamonas brunnea]MBA5637611.1 response regulator [Rugamonas brunnea]